MFTKSIANSAKKFVERASVAGPAYVQGVNNPKRPWLESTIEGEANYKLGINAAIAAGRFGKGVKRVGQEKYTKGATSKGQTRYPEGVAISEGDWSKGVEPYFAALASIALPKRGPRGSAVNLTRVSIPNNALRQVYEKLAAA